MTNITKSFAKALRGEVNQTAMISAGMNQRCQTCGRPLDNLQDPSSKAVGKHCTACAYDNAEERRAS